MKTIVLPTSRCSRMTSFCMSRRISGSSAENGSSNSRIVGVGGQRPGQADALLHAAGELVGEVVLVAGQADQVDHLLGLVAALRLALAAHLEAEGDVVDHLAVRQQAEVLEDHRDTAAQCRAAALSAIAVMSSPSIFTVPAVGSISRVSSRTSVDLPEPGQAHDHEDLAGRDVEADVPDADHVAGLLLQLLAREVGVGPFMIASALGPKIFQRSTCTDRRRPWSLSSREWLGRLPAVAVAGSSGLRLSPGG